jgi:uncharacterized protein YneF (UPF0154 family)
MKHIILNAIIVIIIILIGNLYIGYYLKIKSINNLKNKGHESV